MSTAVAQSGLSCYTANLAGYLLGRREDALDVIAHSVRLAVRPGEEPAFSHHAIPLHRLPPDGELRYTGVPAGSDLLGELAREMDRRGQVLVLAGSAALPWSVAEPGHSAPHLLLVDGRDGRRWHVVDDFAALLPTGRQDPFQGWIGDQELVKAMEPDPAPPAEHRLRNEHAFGFPVPLAPDGTYQWLALRSDWSTDPVLPGDWLTGAESAFDWLTGFWSDLDSDNQDRRRFLDDMWACSQHHSYRYARLVATRDAEPGVFNEAIEAWQSLPMTLRFAADSAQRGRPRAAMVRTTFEQLRDADGRARALLPEYGYPAVP